MLLRQTVDSIITPRKGHKIQLTFSFATSADFSRLTVLVVDLDFEATSPCSWRDAYIDCTVSSKNRSPPCLAIKDTETGHLLWYPSGTVTCIRWHQVKLQARSCYWRQHIADHILPHEHTINSKEQPRKKARVYLTTTGQAGYRKETE